MNWKPALYEYVKAANERESGDGSCRTPQERFRLERLKAWYRERGAKPLGCDTVLSIRHVREKERETIVDLDLRRKLYVFTNRLEHTEERVDRERVTLQLAEGGEWRVVRAEPLAAENASGGVLTASHLRTAPFLNERILAARAAVWTERSQRYNREAVRAYAERHWNEPNAQFITFDVDCTNYVSQCLYAGGAPMNYTGMRESGWWYKGRSGGKELWSFSWSVAHAFHWYLMGSRPDGLRAERVHTPQELTIGDVICYDFDGDGKFEHSVIVTGADGAGMPLVNAHTTNSRNRYWDYRDSYAWTERTAYRFFHISDVF